LKNEYIYISIGICTLIINIILIAMLFNMNSGSKQKTFKSSAKEKAKNSSMHNKAADIKTVGVEDENLSYAEENHLRHNINDQSNGTVLLEDDNKTEVLDNNRDS